MDVPFEARVRAQLFVFGQLLERLWVEEFDSSEMPIEDARDVGNAMLGEMDDLLTQARLVGTDIAHDVAIDLMDGFWRGVRRTLASLEEPIDLVLPPRPGTRQETPDQEGPIDGPDVPPDL
ncbi:MAG: hypothetical protein ACRYFW_14410 [Janthinobacterium lividum]